MAQRALDIMVDKLPAMPYRIQSIASESKVKSGLLTLTFAF